jgi:hypothetical protein
VEVIDFLKGSGFHRIDTAIVHREDQPPHLETLLATAHKP